MIGSRLASHDLASLAARLPSRSRTSARRVLRHAWSRWRAGGEADGGWTDEALWAAGVGARDRAALLGMEVAPSLTVVDRAPASDGTLRLLLRAEGGALIESVLIPGPGRTTLCVSSQVGCARACAFCETGAHGLTRQLDASEIVDQVRLAAAEQGSGPPLSNLVFMGMGEPFDNLAEVLRAIRLLTDPSAFAFAPSRVTVSTVGVVDKLPAFFAGARAELAVSLNATTDAQRDDLMPINRRVPLAALREALVRTLPRGRNVFFEYVLFGGVNDADADADRLAEWTRGLPCRVNVIPSNPGPDPRLGPPSSERLEAFVARLAGHGITTLVRRPRGRDVGGACGQLAGARRTLPLVPRGGTAAY